MADEWAYAFLRIDDFSDAPDTGESVLNSGNWSIREIAAELGASQERGAMLPGEALPGAATRSPRRAQEGRLAHGVAVNTGKEQGA